MAVRLAGTAGGTGVLLKPRPQTAAVVLRRPLQARGSLRPIAPICAVVAYSRWTRSSQGSLEQSGRASISKKACSHDEQPPHHHRVYQLHHPASRRRSSAWAAAVSVAGNIVSNAISRAKTNEMAIDPLRVVAKEMKYLIGDVRKLLGSGHPALDRVAKYYTQAEGKHMRPLIVLLMSRATVLCPKVPEAELQQASQQHQQHPANYAQTGTGSSLQQAPLLASAGVDMNISPLSVLSDFNPAWAPSTSPPSSSSSSLPPSTPSADDTTEVAEILPSQRRLAEITELIHTASLLHDDVIDHSESRRGAPSANLEFGNKMAVLAGDFLLGRASVALARLRNAEVVELLATVIANLVEGEFMQLKNTASDEAKPVWSEATLQYYLQKTYLKTASLISKSCRAAALLGGRDSATVEAAYGYGKNLGLAFQLVDDMLDYTRSAKDLGKPAGADLELGLATAPLLFAWRDRPELGALVGRKFSEPGDAKLVCCVFVCPSSSSPSH